MKTKSNLLLLLLAAIVLSVSIVSFKSCDMTYLDPDDENSDLTFFDNDPANLNLSPGMITIIGLPANARKEHISAVSVFNSTAAVASCNNYDNVSVLTTEEGYLIAKIPLHFSSRSSEVFDYNGMFALTFSVNVDLLTRIVYARNDELTLEFTDGGAVFDLRNIYDRDPNVPENSLTIKGLPWNTRTEHISAVSVFNASSAVASCRNYDDIILTRTVDGQAAASIPLRLLSNDGVFDYSGTFIVAFSVNVDLLYNISYNRSHNFSLVFTDGFAEFDIRNMQADTSGMLTIHGLPLNTRKEHFSSVLVFNSTNAVASGGNYDDIILHLSDNGYTADIPLQLSSGNGVFDYNGVFIVAFTVNVDLLTRIVYTRNDNLTLAFTGGCAVLDLSGIYNSDAASRNSLTIHGLPWNTRAEHISSVSVHNSSAAVALCKDYGSVSLVKTVDGYTTAAIPLHFSNNDYPFNYSGTFIVTFSVNVDLLYNISYAPSHNFSLVFTDGFAEFDVRNMPVNASGTLVIHGLPLNTKKEHISSVAVYNLNNNVALCRDYNDIALFPSNNGGMSAHIPLHLPSGNDAFEQNGAFVVAFSVNIDVFTNIAYARNDNLTLEFSNGYAAFDLNSDFGLFNIELTNPADENPPVIRSGSSFYIDGRHTVTSNTTPTVLVPTQSCILYLYAYRLNNSVFFEYSTSAPAYNPSKAGWYLGAKRAIYKMYLFYDNGSSLFLFKTKIHENWPHLSYRTISSSNTVYQSLTAINTVNGNNNPAPSSITLQPGVYVLRLSAAGGGGGRGYYTARSGNNAVAGASRGGNGGFVTEVLSVGTAVTFTAFTGSGGYAAAVPVFSTDNFGVVAHDLGGWSAPGGGPGGGSSGTIDQYSTSPAAFSGGGGGGGGSGTFFYSAQGYFLCAGGGGGGSGGSYALSPGGAGGAGGTVGSGAGGGMSGYVLQEQNTNFLIQTQRQGIISYSSYSSGGNGGGNNAGPGGTNGSPNGGNGSALISPNNYSYNGSNAASITPSLNSGGEIYSNTNSGNGGQTSFTYIYDFSSYPVNAAFFATNNANGQGASARNLNPLIPTLNEVDNSSGGTTRVYTTTSYDFGSPLAGTNGSNGGNNRNSNRGGGSAGGAVSNNAPSNGSPGVLEVFQAR